MMCILIRPMTLEDLPDVREIDKNSFTLPWPENSFRYELSQNPSSQLWVAEKSISKNLSKIIGMICVWIIVDEAHIATLAVHPDFRQGGIGTKLVAKALYSAYNLDARSAYLDVRASNTNAQKLYKKFGFEVVNRRIKYYSDNHEDALLMNLEEIDPQVLEKYL